MLWACHCTWDYELYQFFYLDRVKAVALTVCGASCSWSLAVLNCLPWRLRYERIRKCNRRAKKQAAMTSQYLPQTHCCICWMMLRPDTAGLSASARCNSICSWSLPSPGDCSSARLQALPSYQLWHCSGMTFDLRVQLEPVNEWLMCVYWHAAMPCHINASHALEVANKQLLVSIRPFTFTSWCIWFLCWGM